MIPRLALGSSGSRRRVGRGAAALLVWSTLAGAACSDATPVATAPVTLDAGTRGPESSAPGGTPTTPAEASSAVTVPAETAPAETSILAADPAVVLEPIGTFEQPVDLAWRSGDDTLFVVERPGRVVPVRSGRTDEAVLDLSDRTRAEGERGLLGLAFSLDGTLAYVNHTDLDGTTVVAEYAVGPNGGFDPATRRVLLEIDQPYANHNGGSIAIGPDAMLWIGMGDGGAGGDPDRRALDLSSLLGKILRIDPTPTADRPYRIPADNPFVATEGARPEIWSIGVRNPWRMAFDRTTGDLWFGDVGEQQVEEIDVAWAADGTGRGANWGWSAYEGTRRFNDDQPGDGAQMPLHEYDHDAGCSVTGGDVYRGRTIGELFGWYVFGDYCSGVVSALRLEGRTVERVRALATLEALTAIRSGPDGELYALSLNGPIAALVPQG